MNLLFLSRWYPYPPDNGSKVRILNLIKQLSARHTLDLVSFTSEPIVKERLDDIRRYCRSIEVVRHRPFQPTRWKALLGFASPRPRSVVDEYSKEMQSLTQRVACERRLDLIIVSQLSMVPYALTVSGLPRILEEVELTLIFEQFARAQRLAAKLRCGLTWWKAARYIGRVLTAFSGCTVVSAGERERVWQVAPGYQPIEVVPNGVDTAHYAADFGPPKPNTLVYSGALTYSANFDAMMFFLGEIFPLVKKECPDARLSITGKLGDVPIDRLPHLEGVTFTGYLDDIRPTVGQSWLSIVPLRQGGGTRLKILEAMAIGTPVVATSKGAEGLELTPGRDLQIADTPGDFAAAVVRLLRNADLRASFSQNGRETVRSKYDWSLIGQKFSGFVETVAARQSETKHTRLFSAT